MRALACAEQRAVAAQGRQADLTYGSVDADGCGLALGGGGAVPIGRLIDCD